MEKTASILKALGHTDRLRIVSLLSRGELTVTELVDILQLSQPRITQYIKSLEAAGLVERLREGSWVFSRIKRGQAEVSKLVATVLECISRDDPIYIEDDKRLQEIREKRSRIATDFFAAVANDQGQLGNEYLPQAQIETALLQAIEGKTYNRMIDMGTGTGRMLELFSKNIKSGTGIDMNPDMLKVARHKLAADAFSHIAVQQSDLLETPFKQDSADLVTLHQVLHYLEEPYEAIKEASRLLKKGGDLIIVDFETHEEERFRENYAHRRLGFSQKDMEVWSHSAGLKLLVQNRIEIKDSPAVVIWKATQNQ